MVSDTDCCSLVDGHMVPLEKSAFSTYDVIEKPAKTSFLELVQTCLLNSSELVGAALQNVSIKLAARMLFGTQSPSWSL